MANDVAKDLVAVEQGSLTAAQFGALADVPPELEWLANITNPHTRRAYKNDVDEFVAFTRLRSFAELRGISRAHVIAWRKHLESRKLSPSTIRASSRRCRHCSIISASPTPSPAIRSMA